MNQKQTHDQAQEERNGSSSNQTSPSGDKDRSVAEWTTLGISIAILVFILGLTTYLYVRGGEKPAAILVEPQMQELRQDNGGYYLPVIVRNEGDPTVEEVNIEAELDTGAGEPETAQFTVNFLAGGEQVEGTFVFQHDPAEGDLTTRVMSFQEP
ncbi:MAG TPA: TIGR02588 family protein [Thermomicrobiales bacterium]|nr:TIGR02588 family protein [Thermomicrobiales bacterium]